MISLLFVTVNSALLGRALFFQLQAVFGWDTVNRKDRYLGGGGVFIGYKKYLTISKLDTSSIAEMRWCTLHFPNKKPVHLCSFYRPPNISTDPIIELDKS